MAVAVAYPVLVDGKPARITSQFSARNPSRPNHKGVDIPAPQGAGVRNVYAGTVESVIQPKANADGQVVVAQQAPFGSLRVAYVHLSRVVVKKGQHLATGRKLGEIGTAGGIPHLHFEVHDPSGPIDPNYLLAGKQLDTPTDIFSRVATRVRQAVVLDRLVLVALAWFILDD